MSTACILWDGSAARAREAGPGTSGLPADYSCSLCHRKDGELWTPATPAVKEESLADDIHWQKGILCHDCHGGSPTLDAFRNHRDDPDFRTLRSREMVPAFCGHCHSNIEYMRQYAPSARTDQEAEYWTSGHGHCLKASASGEKPQVDQKVATCTDCHGGHGMLPVNNSASPVYWANVAETCARCHSKRQLMEGRTYHGRPMGHDQYDEWKRGVHGSALLEKRDASAPTCNDCHGNHGATPRGVASVANACGTCHGKIAKLFADTSMKHKFEEVRLPGCATCHGDHHIAAPSDAMLGVDKGGVCARCHNPQHPEHGATLVGADVAQAMRLRIDELKQGITAAELRVAEAEELGMEVRGPRFDLRLAFDALTNARTLIHSFRPEPVDAVLDEGLSAASRVNAAADDALREHANRRVWLAISLGPILLVVCLLVIGFRSLPTANGDSQTNPPEV